MKYLLTVLTLTITGCYINRPVYLKSYRDPITEGKRFSDSLKNNDIDTIVTYCYAPAGGMSGLVTDYYVYWKKGGIPYLNRFSSLTDFAVIKHLELDVGYFIQNFDSVCRENPPLLMNIQSHYKSHEYMALKFGSQECKFDVVSYQKSKMTFSKRLMLIDKFRSYLFDVNGWQGLHYLKAEKD